MGNQQKMARKIVKSCRVLHLGKLFNAVILGIALNCGEKLREFSFKIPLMQVVELFVQTSNWFFGGHIL